MPTKSRPNTSATQNPSTIEQPSPTGNGAEIWPLVIDDMQARSALGIKRYRTPLRANNGRDSLVDAYHEALDLAVYLRQVIEERECAACHGDGAIPDFAKEIVEKCSECDGTGYSKLGWGTAGYPYACKCDGKIAI